MVVAFVNALLLIRVKVLPLVTTSPPDMVILLLMTADPPPETVNVVPESAPSPPKVTVPDELVMTIDPADTPTFATEIVPLVAALSKVTLSEVKNAMFV